MPPITLHMVLAQRISDDLGFETLATHEGAYTLGAASPDIRVLTRQSRAETHFFDLDTFEHQDSVAAFFESFRQLALPEHLNGETAAWVAGYLTHLAMDEQYITTVYRPVFLKHEALGGHIRANVMDRLLQFELDRQYGNDDEVSDRLVQALAGTVEGIECGFIDHETLDRWRSICCDIAARNMDWEVMRRMIGNHLRHAGIEHEDDVNEFLEQLPELRDETRAYITDDEVTAFVDRAVDIARRQVEEYLR